MLSWLLAAMTCYGRSKRPEPPANAERRVGVPRSTSGSFRERLERGVAPVK